MVKDDGYPQIGESLVCPVCNQRFKATEDTRYLINGNYTCNWKCFFNYYNEHEKVNEEKKRKIKE